LAEGTRIRILVVDDEFSIVESLREIFLWEGYEVETAPNGRLGLEAVARERPALILLDVMMPVMDGLAMLRELRANPETAAIPVVLMSAAPFRSTPDALGYQAALRKPFEAQVLLRTIRALVA
jgi:two-component system, chemotaxis family, chemotaxis protein CheY